VNVTGRSVFFQLHFENPNEVSPFLYEDEISIVIYNKTFFKSWDQERTLEHDITVLNSTLPKQMEITEFSQNFEENVELGSDGVKTLMKAQLSMNAIFSRILGKLAVYVATLQIIHMMPMQRVGLPSLLKVFLSITIGIADFDVIDPDNSTKLLYNFVEVLTESEQAKFDELIP